MNAPAATALVAAAAAAAAAVTAGLADASTKRPHAALATTVASPRQAVLARLLHTRSWVISYRAHTGRTRLARLLLPSWYGPHRHPRIPLVISPHGRGTDGSANARLWGDLPGIGGFAVVNPDGEGDRLGAYSWGAPGQVDDLARMPGYVRSALPWLRVDRSRIYAVGGSMGGQETLLLLGRHGGLLAGAAAFDAVADFAHQYDQFSRLPCNARCRCRKSTRRREARRGTIALASPATPGRATASASVTCIPRRISRTSATRPDACCASKVRTAPRC